MSSDRGNMRPKIWKGSGDCGGMAFGGELSCDLPVDHDGDHFDAEYQVRFVASECPRLSSPPVSQGLMQVIPPTWPSP